MAVNLTFGTPDRLDNNIVEVPVTLDANILRLSASHFNVSGISEVEIQVVEYSTEVEFTRIYESDITSTGGTGVNSSETHIDNVNSRVYIGKNTNSSDLLEVDIRYQISFSDGTNEVLYNFVSVNNDNPTRVGFNVRLVSGDPSNFSDTETITIKLIRYDYKLIFQLPEDVSGSINILPDGTVYNTDTNMFDDIDFPDDGFSYDTRIPDVVDFDAPGDYTSGEPLYFFWEFSVPASGFNGLNHGTQQFIYEGENITHFGSPDVFGYIGSNTSKSDFTFPLSETLGTDWETADENSDYKFIAVRLMPDETATGIVSVTLRDGVIRGPRGITSSPGMGQSSPIPRQTQTAPNIEQVGPLNIVIEEPYSVDIDITGSFTEAWIDGLYKKFGYRINGNTLTIFGTADELLSDGRWTVNVRWSGGVVQSVIRYNFIHQTLVIQSEANYTIYQGFPVNIVIQILNIFQSILINGLLLSLYWEESEDIEGINILGTPTEDNISVDSGSFDVMASNTAGALMRNSGITVEDGTPPSPSNAEFTGKGAYGVLDLPDVNNALGYEWTTDVGDDPDWKFFSDSRNLIDIDQIDVTPGNLEVTIKFPNVTDALKYEYSLESEMVVTEWTEFDFTLSNNMITTIIPDLEDGTEYTLRLRVASPWVGEHVTITVYGGRICYTLQTDNSDRDNQWLYIFHTGHAHGSTASRIKRLLLPTSLSYPSEGGLAVNSEGDVFILNLQDGAGNEKALYVFEADTIESADDGSRLTQDRKNPFPSESFTSNALRARGMGEYDGDLYIYFNTASSGPDWREFRVVPIPTTDGTELTTTGGSRNSEAQSSGISVTDESIWHIATSGRRAGRLDRQLFTIGNIIIMYDSNGTNADQLAAGLKVIGNVFYNINDSGDKLEVFRINPEVHETRHVLDFVLDLPAGLSRPKFLDILV